ncbi:MAG: hypothetical protein K5925_04345, partial [Bacilli bacterium]|nr:hypothetical protein [Bacilli bacterium]
MRIDHGNAITLEHIVRKVYNCDRFGMGGYINSDHFEFSPFDAALIALAPLWQRIDSHTVEDFLFKWENVLRKDDRTEQSISDYINELDELVTTA